MRTRWNLAIAAIFCGLAGGVCWAQAARPEGADAKTVAASASPKHAKKADRTLSADDGLSVIAAALDSRGRQRGEHDCSHLVHGIYERAGYPYTYASSDDLYDGVDGFRRVSKPQPGDLIVWHGHAGIVVRPSKHIFFSFKSIGPATDDYTAKYWKSRGQPRFYRYVKSEPCPGCAGRPLRQARAAK